MSKDEIKLKALTPNIQRSKYLDSCNGMIAEAFNLAIKSEVKDKKILLDLREGLTGPFNDKIRVVQEFLWVWNTSWVFWEITFKKLLEHYNIPYKAEWKNLRLNIRNEGEEEKNKENQNNRSKECMQLISDRKNLLQEYNWGAYDNKVAAFKEEYINWHIKDKEDFVKKLDDVFFNNDWIYKWKWKADVKYTYKWKLNEKWNPISGRVDFEINWNPLYYEWSWDKDGRIVKCKSKWDITKEEYSINIYYKAGSIPYFSTSNGLNLSLKLIWNNDVADIWRIASMINSMTSTVRRNVIGMERHFDCVKVWDNLHWKDAKNGLIAVFKWMERNVNLKSNVMESMYLRDNEEDVIRWFNQYFNEQLKNN